MSLLTNKLTALTLAGTLGLVSFGTISYASTVPTSIISNTQKIQQFNSNVKLNSQSSFIQMMKPYVQIKNNKYTISSKIYENKNVTLSEINKLKTMLNKANEIAFKTNTQNDLNLRNGTTVIVNTPNTNQQNTNEFAAVCGQTKVVYFWWGCYIYLNNVQTMWVGTATTVTACAFLTALVPGIGGAVAAGIAGMVGGVCAFYSPELEYGSVISWNYLEGPQEIWAQ